jgi:hypothetical protein
LPKVVRIEYTFRGRGHYAEVGDWQPIVLPLSGELSLFCVNIEMLKFGGALSRTPDMMGQADVFRDGL